MNPERQAPSPQTDRRFEAFLVFSCIVLALVLRAWAFHLRRVLDYDETYYYILGRNLLTGHGYRLNGLPHTAFPPLYPVLVGLTNLLFDNIRAATSLVSLFAGSLLPLPVYLLAREVSGKRAALLAAASAAALPALFFFAAHGVIYRRRLYAGSEPLFLTLAAFGLLFLYRAARPGKWFHSALAGLFFGLAALTRNEALIIFAFLLAWLALTLLLSPARRRFLPLVIPAAVAFLVVLSPFIIYVHSAGGQWGLGSKLPNFARIRPALYGWVENGKPEQYLEIHYGLSDDATAMKDAYWGVSGNESSLTPGESPLRTGLDLVASPDLRWLRVFARVFTKGRPPLVPLYAWPFIAVGFYSLFCSQRGRRFLALAAALLFAQLFLGVSIFVLARFELPLLIILAVPLGLGLDTASRAAACTASRLSAKAPPRASALLTLVILSLMIADGIRANLRDRNAPFNPAAIASTPFDMEVADQLAASLPPGSSLMCNKPWLAASAGLDWRVSPDDTPDRILKYALANDIDCALLGPWQMKSPLEDSPLSYYLTDVFTGADTLFFFDFTGQQK